MRSHSLLRIHLAATPRHVYERLNTDAGRASFWAETACEREGLIHFTFPDGQQLVSEVLERASASRFSIRYFGGCIADFQLRADGHGGTDLTLEVRDLPPRQACEDRAGWVSVLLALKAAADFGVDLRNHSRSRSWANGFVDN